MKNLKKDIISDPIFESKVNAMTAEVRYSAEVFLLWKLGAFNIRFAVKHKLQVPGRRFGPQATGPGGLRTYAGPAQVLRRPA